jgi:hypothetical protein
VIRAPKQVEQRRATHLTELCRDPHRLSGRRARRRLILIPLIFGRCAARHHLLGHHEGMEMQRAFQRVDLQQNRLRPAFERLP